MAQETHWSIAGDSYPLTFAFKWADIALVHELTGLSWEEFVEPINGLMSRDNGDEQVQLSAMTLLGLLAVGVRRVHPTWSRTRVRKFVENLDQDAAELVTPDDEEDEPGPPEMTAGETSETSADKSESASESTSSASTQEPSGTPTSPTSPEEPSATTT